MSLVARRSEWGGMLLQPCHCQDCSHALSLGFSPCCKAQDLALFSCALWSTASLSFESSLWSRSIAARAPSDAEASRFVRSSRSVRSET
jgi:hypothetical protein